MRVTLPLTADFGNSRIRNSALNLGVNYVVLGIALRQGSPSYLVCPFGPDRVQFPWPIEIAADLVEVVDSRISKSWVAGVLRNGDGTVTVQIGIKHWVENPRFAEAVLNQNTLETRQFIDALNEMTDEYPER